MLALDLALFGLVYRYAVRRGDDSADLRLGVLGAFALPRALFLVQLPAECTPAPLACGEPLGYFNWAMLSQVAWQLFTGGSALLGSLYGLERAFGVGLIRRFSGFGPQVPAAEEAPKAAAPGGDVFKFPWQQ
mmetsp:Transcript_137828/g.344054  ORF Transcript_137828/g.344054 Transcript_137828/m.344054 type:complete len:132 (+) Transcript_137828:128-523(+)